jgi:hypothetical protein
MCGKCIELDKKIAHYWQVGAKIIDQVTIDRIEKLILDLQAQKVALHPEREQ